MKWIVYVLRCPLSGDVRYVGWTSIGIKLRLQNHIRHARAHPNASHCQRWISYLLGKETQPTIEKIDSGEGDEWKKAEKKWIKHFRDQAGSRLTNTTDGGDGCPGRRMSPEQRARQSELMKQRMTPERRAKQAEFAKNQMMSLSPEERNARCAYARSHFTKEELIESAKKAWEEYPQEKRDYIIGKLLQSRPLIASEETRQKRREAKAKYEAQLSPEERSARARKIQANRTPEERSEWARKMNASIPPERRSEIAKKRRASFTLEQRREMSRKAQAAKTPEERSASALKSWATRRAMFT
jgi:hypothetical protein